MATDLSDTPIWFPVTDTILALDGQDVALCLDGCHGHNVIGVVKGTEANGQDDMCAVSVTDAGIEDHPPHEPHHSRSWLTEDQVAAIRPNEDSEPIALLLDLRFPE